MTEDAPETSANGKRLRLEVVVASPPTRKCTATLKIMEEMTRLFPDQVRLDVYALGGSMRVIPTRSCLAELKTWTVPSVYVNGKPVTKKAVPDREEVERKIREELAKGPEAWED